MSMMDDVERETRLDWLAHREQLRLDAQPDPSEYDDRPGAGCRTCDIIGIPVDQRADMYLNDRWRCHQHHKFHPCAECAP